ncbi:MAG: succinylglutamate-semialdehyde dehydrogenase [Spirochaetales bacterium]|nr:succinylglutamate-semialdehyde dehydrogenase [Spirochaetales bacterium]
MEKAHFINGEWRQSGGDVFQARDKCTLESMGDFASAGAVEVTRALESARASLPQWAALADEERFAIMRRYASLISNKKEEIALLISRETGKPLAEGRQEADTMAAKVELSIQARLERQTELSRIAGGSQLRLRWRPLGVVAVYGPFNMPGHLPGSHFVPALIAGNTVVFKPSELTPVTGAWITSALAESGLPPGVFHCLQGQKTTGVEIASRPVLDGLFFTGSSATGKALAAASAGHVDRLLALEMGGNNALVVHEIQDPLAAARQTVLSAYITAGQRCTCARRLIVPHGEEGDRFLLALQDLVQKIRVGFYDESPPVFMGPLISERSVELLLAAQEQLRVKGARLLCESRRLRNHPLLLSPGLADVTGISVPDEEIFGPFLQVIRTRDFATAIVEANRTSYGLAAGLLSDNRGNWEIFRKQAQAGVVNWNRQTTGASGQLPFGGIGQSGNYRPGGYFAIDYCAYPVASLESESSSTAPLAGVED